MLTVYRRHLKSCPHRNEGRKYRRCRCPIWADGFLLDEELRKSLNTRDWDKAQSTVRDWEAKGKPVLKQETKPIAIKQACDAFTRDAKARNLREATLYKYRLLFRQLQRFANEKGDRFILELNLEAMREFRASWTNQNLGALKKLEYLRAFFRFAHESNWIPENPARKIKNPKVSPTPTMPFTREELARILAACDEFGRKFQGETRAKDNARCARAFVLLLRYSGLRISDAVSLERSRVVGNKLFLYTAKTGTPVYCLLPDFVINALDALPLTSEKHFFWTGESSLQGATGNWQKSLKELFRLAKVPAGHAHRFRDTFTVELLLAGVPIDRVSVLLGHNSTRVTERHYAPWVRARQKQLEADIKKSWEFDQNVPPASTKGTPEVHGKARLPN